MWIVRREITLNTDEACKPMAFRSHVHRDTFAVEMLLAGVSLEKISKLLTRDSINMTERYYTKWTSWRQQLEDDAIAAFRHMGATVTFNHQSMSRSCG